MKYKVMIVEDQTMPRELFELRIQASEHFEVALSIDNAGRLVVRRENGREEALQHGEVSIRPTKIE